MPITDIPVHCAVPARRRGDRWSCTNEGCGAWKWVVPRDEYNRWRAGSTLPKSDIRKNVLALLPDGMELYSTQIANFLGRDPRATYALLVAMEKDGCVTHRYISVNRDHTIMKQICLWRSTGKALPECPTPVEDYKQRDAEHERRPVFSADALVAAMGRR